MKDCSFFFLIKFSTFSTFFLLSKMVSFCCSKVGLLRVQAIRKLKFVGVHTFTVTLINWNRQRVLLNNIKTIIYSLQMNSYLGLPVPTETHNAVEGVSGLCLSKFADTSVAQRLGLL